MKYRPEIDGLRAVAVVAVILFHAGFSAFSGGFVGVDVFFVISGYLIATIIMSEIAEGTFTLVGFYERRARRILPALFLVILCSAPFAWQWMDAREVVKFVKSIGSIIIFCSNFFFSARSGYFSGAIELKPFIHTWSLAVEEQFYLFFPLLMLILWRFGNRAVMSVVAVIFVLSLGASQWASNNSNEHIVTAGFYLAHSRAWELLLGVFLAKYLLDRPAPRVHIFNNIASVLGLAMIVYAMFAFDQLTPFPGLYALVPTLGTALIILFANGETLVGRILSLKGMVSVGLISYSAYLWHQPLFAFARIRSMSAPSSTVFIGLGLAALVLGWLSWRYVERPFRNRGLVSRRQIFAISALVATGIVGGSFVVGVNHGFPGRFYQNASKWEVFVRPRQKERAGCANAVPEDGSCVLGAKVEPTVAFVGDSHSDALAMMSGNMLSSLGIGGITLTHNGCIPIAGLRRAKKAGECKQFNDKVLVYLQSHKNIDTIILSARWTLAVESSRFNNMEGGIEHGPRARFFFKQDSKRRLTSKMVGHRIKTVIENFLALGKRVILVYPVPEVGWDPLRYAFRKTNFEGVPFDSLTLSTSYDVFRNRNKRAISALDSIPKNDRLLKVKPAEIFCDTFLKDRCAVAINGKQFYRDSQHVGRDGAELVLEKIKPFLVPPTGIVEKNSSRINSARTKEPSP